MAYEAWQYRDPAWILERKQERAARTKQGKADKARQGLNDQFKGAPTLTQDQSDDIERLLLTWYRHEAAYMPNLGAPRVSPSCRGHDVGEVHDDGDDRDAKLERITAEAVASCVDQLHYLQRAAINVTMRCKVAGVSIHRNPRLGGLEQQHTKYQEAKMLLLPMLKRKGLMR